MPDKKISSSAVGRKFAVFDIDGTIFRSSLLIETVEALIAAGVFPDRARIIYDGAHRKWLDRQGTYEKYIGAVIEAFDHYIAGVSEADFVPVIQRMIRLHRDRVYRYTRDLVRDLKRQGYFMLAISHSPKYVVEAFGRSAGFDKVYGRLLELTQTGHFTGRTLFQDVIFDKKKVLERAVEKERLSYAGSVGVGDTESDIGFLRLVERPICFNPNMALYRVAKRNNWTVVVERKDVVYEMNTQKVSRSVKGK
ncbi:MAG TPA: HAD-IB family phosphatase [Candidatus Paceibacterota bacterium]|nr:HAD-IB family phosphatase [Candidatus Paceibacterota bacterium]